MQLMQLTDEDFLAALQQQFGYRLGRLEKTQTRYTYPLKQMRRSRTDSKSRYINWQCSAYITSDCCTRFKFSVV